MKKIAFAFVAAALCASAPALAEDAPAAAGTDTTTTTTAAPDATATTATATTTTTTETTAAPAAAPAKGGVEIGLRVGYGIPLGNAVKDVKLGDTIKGQIPIRLDVGYRINPNFYVGAYFSYGIAMINKDNNPSCSKNGVDCSASTLGYGIMAAYHISPAESFDPWVGLGIGLEQATLKASAGGVSQSATTKGLTYVDVQVGGDFKAGPNLMVGPFVSLAAGQYSSVSADNGGGDIQDKAMHEWLTIGIRGAYGIW